MSVLLTRRTALIGSAAAALAMPNIARAAPTDLIIGTNGGEEFQSFYRAAYASFEQKYNVRIVPVFGDGATLLNRAIAEKDAPTMDATVTFQGGWLVGQAEGVFETVDYERIPHVGDVYDFLRDPKGFAPFINFAAWGLVYNKETISKPPRSIRALWDPAYADKVMIGGIYHWQIHLAAFAQAWGGDQTMIDLAFDKAKLLAPNLAGFYGLSSDAQSKFTQGLADIATWYSDIAQRLRAMGVPLGFQVPEEGAFLYPMSFQAIAGTPRRDLVEKLIGHFYDPVVCQALARTDGRIPGNKTVTLDAPLRDDLLSIQEVMQAHQWNWSFINAHQSDWLTRWNGDIRPLVHS